MCFFFFFFTFVPRLAFSSTCFIDLYSVPENWTKDVNGYKFWFSKVWRTFLVTLKNQLYDKKCVKWKLKGEILGFLNFFIRNGPSMGHVDCGWHYNNVLVFYSSSCCRAFVHICWGSVDSCTIISISVI